MKHIILILLTFQLGTSFSYKLAPIIKDMAFKNVSTIVSFSLLFLYFLLPFVKEKIGTRNVLLLVCYPIFQIFKEGTTTQKPTEAPIDLLQPQTLPKDTDVGQSSEILNEVPKTLPLTAETGSPKPTPNPTTQKATETPTALPQTQNLPNKTDVGQSSEIQNEVPKTLSLAPRTASPKPKPTAPPKPTIDAPNCKAYNYKSPAGRNMTIKLCSKKTEKQERLKIENVSLCVLKQIHTYMIHMILLNFMSSSIMRLAGFIHCKGLSNLL